VTTLDVVAIGDINWDEVIRLTYIPGPDEEVRAIDVREAPGGDAANFAVASARMGTAVGLIGAVGNDLASVRLMRHLSDAKVDTLRIRIVPQISGRVYAFVEPNGVRRLVSFRGANAAWSLDEEDYQYLQRCAWIYVADPIPDVVQKLGEWYEHGRLHRNLAFDPGSACVVKGRPFLQPLIPYVQLLLVNETEAKTLANCADCMSAAIRLAKDIPLVVVKRGEKGCLVVSGGEMITIPAFPVRAVDTTGCGDAFNAAFLFQLQRGGGLKEAARWGNAAGALVAQQIGAGPVMPRRDEIDAFLSQQRGGER